MVEENNFVDKYYFEKETFVHDKVRFKIKNKIKIRVLKALFVVSFIKRKWV